jgi:glycosyltransferase involved in cell wall biosynthesis
MKLLICTQAIDENDPLLGFFVRWVKELAERFDYIEIICLRKGAHTLPNNVRIHTLGRGRYMRILRLEQLAWTLRSRYDTVFVHMNPEYVVVAGLLWKLLKKRVALWYNHPADNLRLRMATLFVARVFHTSPYAATAGLSKARQMPVGIDTVLFAPQPVPRVRTALYMQGRIMPSKRVEVALAALRLVRKEIPGVTLTLVGPEDPVYARQLKERFSDLIGDKAVEFLGPRKNSETSRFYSAHGIVVNLAASGHFDKSVFEGMACETPAVVSSQAFNQLVPLEWIVLENDAPALAEALIRLLRLPETGYQALGATSRRVIEEGHSLTLLVEKLTEDLSTSYT